MTKRRRILRFILGASIGTLLSSVPSAFAASHAVTYGHNATDLLESLIPNGSGITIVGAPTITGYSSGPVTSYGQFNSATAASGIPFTSGVILSTGDIRDSIGHDNNLVVSSSFDTAGSPLLSGATADAVTLTFQFRSAAPTFSFQYMFASEEYNDLFAGDYNDPFAFILNGPGAVNLNLAKVPTTLTDVSISSVNAASNSQYFYDNTAGAYDIQYDGLAGSLGGNSLSAIGNVQIGELYTLSIVLADLNDSALDSALFLQQGSFLAEGFTGETPVPEPATLLGALALTALVLKSRRHPRSELPKTPPRT